MDAIPTEGKRYDLIEAASGDVLGLMNTDNEAKNTVLAKYVIEIGLPTNHLLALLFSSSS
jgi:hypothetical protein